MKLGYGINYASDVLSQVSNNADGYAEILLPGSGSVILHGVDAADLKPRHFRVMPAIDNVIKGTYENDILVGTDGNDYIKGSELPQGRFSDGFDIIDGGKGNDSLEGGDWQRAAGGTEIDLYRFDADYGEDTIFGFYADDILLTN